MTVCPGRKRIRTVAGSQKEELLRAVSAPAGTATANSHRLHRHGANAECWWRRWELNPRPENAFRELLRAYPLFEVLVECGVDRGNRCIRPASL